MACEHKRIRCTDNEYFCADCGARVEAEKPKEPEKKPAKRTAKKKTDD